ncbi:MAG: hypothetical protein ACM3QW_07780 [Ignavibacteriales bacterium]
MTIKEKSPEKAKKSPGIIIGYVLGSLASLFGAGLLALNIISFTNNYGYYLSQGYPPQMVLQQLVPSQLLPGIFEPIAIYGGIAFLIFTISAISQKVSEGLAALTEANECTEVCKEEEIASESTVTE